jgi:p-hydroxybenzoate 3-monooxygenase
MLAYGQTAITEDLYSARDAADGIVIDEAANVALHDLTTDAPFVTFDKNRDTEQIDCDYVIGCDGFHGVSRRCIPRSVLKTYNKSYPFGWLGVMSETRPLPDIVYANSERGFALASQRSERLSRYYIQCPLDHDVEEWPDDLFWQELKARFPGDIADAMETGPTIEKSIAPLRSFVAEPMRYGRLFLAGDAAHIVPPTGAKGLNLAVSDVRYLSRAFIAHYAGDDGYLDGYSEMALRRVWGAARFSWWLTTLLHRFPHQTPFDQRAQEQELSHLAASEHAQRAFAEQYVGLPYE